MDRRYINEEQQKIDNTQEEEGRLSYSEIHASQKQAKYFISFLIHWACRISKFLTRFN